MNGLRRLPGKRLQHAREAHIHVVDVARSNLVQIDQRYVNLGRVRISGIDASVVRRVPVGSLQQLMRLLSESNVALLNIVRSQKPRSVAELARLTGRPKASLTQTLRRLERFGLISFRPTTGRRKTPEIVCDKVRLDVVITGENAGAP